MTCRTSHDFHHHFPKIAEESGFTFNIHKPRMHIDWNKIRTIDIESLIRERNFLLIERHLNDILHCVLESEFDVRILDEGVLKMFRLAQLAVEYQQFCRHYLERSVHVLREELTTLIQELDTTKRDLREKEEELKKFRRKSKFNVKTQLPYGNDNIATMILKTLSNKSDIFPSASNVDVLQYNKCSYCDKVFLNQLYLKSHISRRHLNVLVEMPQKDVGEQIQNISLDKANSKLNEEITELKAKIQEMENLITKTHNQPHPSKVPEIPVDKNKENSCRSSEDKIMENKNNTIEAKMKDAEVSTNSEVYLLDKIEEWKKEEHDKYNKEINLLRTQILETINSFKEKDTQRSFENESSIIEQLHTTIKQQGTEILSLKQELTNAKLLTEKEEIERRKVADAQMSLWTKRVEAQSKQYESLLQKLNEVAKEAYESRTLAKAEQERAAQLQEMLQQAMNQEPPHHNERLTHHKKTNTEDNDFLKSSKHNFSHQPNSMTDRKTLESLHRKAQELLNIGSSSSSEMSSTSIEETKFTDKTKSVDKKRPLKNGQTNNTKKKEKDKLQHGKKTKLKTSKIIGKQEPSQVIETKEQKLGSDNNNKSYSNISEHIKNSPHRAPASPIKIIRAKLTEEVNSRLVSVGVDPLKCRLPQNIFRKQRIQLQQQNEAKSKKNPDYQKIRHSILTYLDANVPDTKKDTFEPQDYISPSKIAKAFSIGSVISNVKSKALSLVKSNDVSSKTKGLKNKTFNADVAKKAMTLLKTPPGSAPVSPVIQRKLIKINTKGISSAKDPKQNSKIDMQKKFSNESTTAEHRTKLAKTIITTASDSGDDSNDSEHKYYNSAIIQDASKTIETLIRSPARRPSSANADYTSSIRKNTINNDKLNLVRAQSTTNVNDPKLGAKHQNHPSHSSGDSSDDIESLIDVPLKKTPSKENIQNVPKQTKGVLKNASSTSSLNKKRVLFDMDAIQMKSLSASPSHSTTEKSDTNEKFELGLVNLDSEEWDISSIENEPLKNDTKIQNSRTSPKIAELKETIESQLARRSETPRTLLVGGVDVLAGPIPRTSSIAGSNTSLGSSILDESEGIPAVNHKAFVKPKRLTEKDESDLDISAEFSIETTNNNKGNDSF